MSTDVPVNTSSSPVPSVPPPRLPDDLSVCHGMIVELVDALQKSQRECAGLQQRLDQLLRRLYGPKAERFDPQQPWLIPELAESNTPAPDPGPESAAGEEAGANGKPPGHGRRKLPADLPPRRIEHAPPEAQRAPPDSGGIRQKSRDHIHPPLDYQP